MKNKNLRKNIFIKAVLFIFLAVIIFNFSKSTMVSAQVDGDIVGGQAVQSLDNLSNGGKGIIPCDTGANPEKCTPKHLVDLIKTLGQVFIYLIVIALVLTLIISGVGYVYYGKNPGYLVKVKKYITNAFYALLIIMLVFGVVLGLLSAVGFNEEVLGFLKQILAFDPSSIHFFNSALAQNIPDIDTGSSTNYVNFFPKQTIGSLLLLTIRFLVNYIAAPALVLAVIYTGFLFVKAQGNPKEIGEAKKFAERVIIGIVIAASASLMVNIALNTVNDVAQSLSSGIGIKKKTAQQGSSNQNSQDFSEGEGADVVEDGTAQEGNDTKKQVTPTNQQDTKPANTQSPSNTSTPSQGSANTNTSNTGRVFFFSEKGYLDKIVEAKYSYNLNGVLTKLVVQIKSSQEKYSKLEFWDMDYTIYTNNKEFKRGTTESNIGSVNKEGTRFTVEMEDILTITLSKELKEIPKNTNVKIVGDFNFLISDRETSEASTWASSFTFAYKN